MIVHTGMLIFLSNVMSPCPRLSGLSRASMEAMRFSCSSTSQLIRSSLSWAFVALMVASDAFALSSSMFFRISGLMAFLTSSSISSNTFWSSSENGL